MVERRLTEINGTFRTLITSFEKRCEQHEVQWCEHRIIRSVLVVQRSGTIEEQNANKHTILCRPKYQQTTKPHARKRKKKPGTAIEWGTQQQEEDIAYVLDKGHNAVSNHEQ